MLLNFLCALHNVYHFSQNAVSFVILFSVHIIPPPTHTHTQTKRQNFSTHKQHGRVENHANAFIRPAVRKPVRLLSTACLD